MSLNNVKKLQHKNVSTNKTKVNLCCQNLAYLLALKTKVTAYSSSLKLVNSLKFCLHKFTLFSDIGIGSLTRVLQSHLTCDEFSFGELP